MFVIRLATPALLALALASLSLDARAATITVGADCSLAEAIQAANTDLAVGDCAAGSGADTIQVPAGVIPFTSAFSLADDPDTALPAIVTPVTIIGAGKTETILQRDVNAPAFRFLNIYATVTLEGLAFERGSIPTTTYGSAIAAGGGDLTVIDCAFTGNDASTGGGGRGGAIGMATSGCSALNVSGSDFDANVGHNAAIYQPCGSAHISTTTFTGNVQPSVSVGYGIVHVQAQGDVVIDDCTFEDNVSRGQFHVFVATATPGTVGVSASRFLGNTGDGPILYLYGVNSGAGTPFVTEGCTFEDNVVTSSGLSVLYAVHGLQRIESSIFKRNTGVQGGAAWLQASAADPITVIDCTFEDNFAATTGGAIYVLGQSGQVFIEDSSFTRNASAGQPGSTSCGGAILVNGYVEIRRTRFSSNSTKPRVSFIASEDAHESGAPGRFTLELEGYGGALCSPNDVAYLVEDSCFVGNTRSAVYGRADARNNWWGAVDGPAGTNGGSGDATTQPTEIVAVVPFLDAPGSTCVGLVPTLVLAVNATADGGATPGDDYEALVPPFEVEPHIGLLPIDIVAVNDSIVEGDETVSLGPKQDDAAYFPGSGATLSIIDDGSDCGMTCDDGIACTSDACDSGTLQCTYTPVAAECDDAKPCTIDSCSAATGCVHTPDDTACDDGISCTTDDCNAGTHACTHTPVDAVCDDGKPCSDDTCTASGCVHTPDDTACDDTFACTTDDCNALTLNCTHTTNAAACNDNKACTVDRCVVGTGCVNGPDDGACDDGIACTADACDAGTGACTHTPVAADCNDGKPCTVDTCTASGCVNTPSAATCDDGVACTTDACNATTGACTHTANAGACDDAKTCTLDTCTATGCAHVADAALCNDNVACTADACDAGTGACTHTPVAADCNDGKPCTIDTCTATGCVYTPDPAACNDNVACTTDACNASTGACTHTPVAASCNDNKACTIDSCTATGCVFTTDAGACDDDNVCTTDTCSASGACGHTNRVGICDDRDPCTSGSTCSAGSCGGGIQLPGCEALRKIDLGLPFGEVPLPVSEPGGLCFSGTKIVDDCAPLSRCELAVEACFYEEGTFVTLELDTQLEQSATVGDIRLVGTWQPKGFCLVGELATLKEGPVTVEAATLITCWNDAGEGFIAVSGTALAAGGEGNVLGGLAVAVNGTLRTTNVFEISKLSGCLTGSVQASAVFPGLPGTFSGQAELSVCIGGGSDLELDEWRPFPDDPGTVARDIKGFFFQDVSLNWSVRIDHALDPILGFCRFILKAGKLAGQKLGTKWLLTLTGTASFDFAGQHVEAGVSAVVVDGSLSLQITSSAELSLYLKHGDPAEDGILVQAKKKLAGGRNLTLRAPSIPTMRLTCTAPETTVDIYGTVTMPFCDESLSASVTVSGSLGEPGFRMEGTASIIGSIGLPLPLILPGLPSIPGPYCLGLASEPRLEWTVCGAPPPPEGGLWLHTTTELRLFGSDPAEVELRVGIDPPNTAGAFAKLGAPVELIGPEDNVPGTESLTLGASEIALQMEACNAERSGLFFVTDATQVTATGSTINYSVRAESSLVRQSAKLTSKNRWLDAYGISGLAVESGSVTAITLSTVDGEDELKLGQRAIYFLKTGGEWPATAAAGDEICDDLPAVDNDGDGRVNCADTQCANHLMCRAAQGAGGVFAVRGAIYLDLARKPGLLGIPIPGFAVRFDMGNSVALPPLTSPPISVADAEHTFVGAANQAARDSAAALQMAANRHPDAFCPNPSGGGSTWGICTVSAGYTLVPVIWPLTDEEIELLAELLGRVQIPEVCDRFTVPCPSGALSITPAAIRADSLSYSFATRDAVYDDLRFAAGVHVVLTKAVPAYTARLEGSFGVGGVSLAGSVVGTPGTVASLFDISAPAALGWGPLIHVALSGDPYDRVARGPSDGGGFIRAGPSLRLDFVREGTVEGFVSRGTWGADPFDSLLAARYGVIAGGKLRGWKIGIGDGGGTGWGRVTFETVSGTGLGVITRAHTLLPVVPPSDRKTHVAVTWKAVTVAGQEILDIGIYIDGQRQEVLTPSAGVPVPAAATGRQLIVGGNLGTLDDFRLWNEARSSLRIAGESVLMPPASASDTGLIIRYDFDRDFSNFSTVAANRGSGGTGLNGVFVSGVTTAPEVNAPVIAARIVAGPAGESAGLHALAGFTITTPAGVAPFRLEALAEGGDLTGSLFAVEVPLVPLGGYGTLCLRDVSANADLTQRDTTGQATLALCRPDGNRSLGTFGVQIRCPAGQICPPGLVIGVNGPLGDTTLTLPGEFRLFLNGNLRADSHTGEVVITGRLGWGVQTFDGTLRWSRDRLTIDTSYDLPPFAPGLPDPGPATLHLVNDLVANTLCGTGQASLAGGAPCTIDVCFEGGAGGGITGVANCVLPAVVCSASNPCAADKMCVAGACLPKLIDGAPCANAGMCQSGHCAVLCYTPDSLPLAALCVVSSPDPCAGDLLCARGDCPPPPIRCPSATCVPPVDAGQQCLAQGQCPSGTTCRRNTGQTIGSTRYCLWPDDSRALGQQCRGNPECTSDLCVLTQCVCDDDADCGSGKMCVAAACVPTPALPRGPGQSCTADGQCTLLKCVEGTCGCTVSSDCEQPTQYCTARLGTLPIGKCLPRRSDGRQCPSDDACQSGHCAGNMEPPICYTPQAASLGQECVSNRHCATGNCQLACNWGGQCSPANAVTSYQQSGQPPAGCSCTTTCACKLDGDCNSGQYCGQLQFLGLSVPGEKMCSPKVGRDHVCDRNAQCVNGDCQSLRLCVSGGVTTIGCTGDHGCASGYHCGGAHLCVGNETCITASKCN